QQLAPPAAVAYSTRRIRRRRPEINERILEHRNGVSVGLIARILHDDRDATRRRVADHTPDRVVYGVDAPCDVEGPRLSGARIVNDEVARLDRPPIERRNRARLRGRRTGRDEDCRGSEDGRAEAHASIMMGPDA